MPGVTVAAMKPTRIASATTTTIFTGPGAMLGVFCSSSTSGTVSIQDGAGNTVVNTFTAVAGTFHPIPIMLNTSLIVVTGGTIDCAVIASPL
jgi:hypothetical protein